MDNDKIEAGPCIDPYCNCYTQKAYKTPVREIASAFEDAPSIRVHCDGSQTYGPYTSGT